LRRRGGLESAQELVERVQNLLGKPLAHLVLELAAVLKQRGEALLAGRLSRRASPSSRRIAVDICPGNLLDSPLWTDPEKGLFIQYLRAGKVPGAKNIEDVRQTYVNQVPMKRGCSYDDVCNAVVFLAFEQSSYITGIALSVTGGQEMS